MDASPATGTTLWTAVFLQMGVLLHDIRPHITLVVLVEDLPVDLGSIPSPGFMGIEAVLVGVKAIEVAIEH